MMASDDWSTLRETREVLSDSALVEAHLTGLRELASGDALGEDDVVQLLDEFRRRDEVE